MIVLCLILLHQWMLERYGQGQESQVDKKATPRALKAKTAVVGLLLGFGVAMAGCSAGYVESNTAPVNLIIRSINGGAQRRDSSCDSSGAPNPPAR